jgi:4-hydroxy-3-methylbut-2-enyl diphosphate reductase IspH
MYEKKLLPSDAQVSQFCSHETICESLFERQLISKVLRSHHESVSIIGDPEGSLKEKIEKVEKEEASAKNKKIPLTPTHTKFREIS